MILIDAKWNRTRGACYDDSRLQSLYDRPLSPREVMCREDGDWRDVSVRDRWWVVSRWLIENPEHHHVFREILARLVDRCAEINTDPRVSLVAEVLRRIPFDAAAARAAARDAAYTAAAAATYAARAAADGVDAARAASAYATYAAADASAYATYAAADAASCAAYPAADAATCAAYAAADAATYAVADAATYAAAWDALRNDCLELLR